MTNPINHFLMLILVIIATQIYANTTSAGEERSVAERSTIERNKITDFRNSDFSEARIARSVERLINGKPLGFGESDEIGWVSAIFKDEKFACGGTLISLSLILANKQEYLNPMIEIHNG